LQKISHAREAAVCQSVPFSLTIRSWPEKIRVLSSGPALPADKGSKTLVAGAAQVTSHLLKVDYPTVDVRIGI
jgi:hypothetical protein